LTGAAALPVLAVSAARAIGAEGCSFPELAAEFETVYRTFATRMIAEEQGDLLDGKRWDEIHQARLEITARILLQPAHTAADVLLQARAYAFSNPHKWVWQEYENYDATAAEARIVVDNLCRINQIEAFPGFKIEPVKYYGTQYEEEAETASAPTSKSEWQSDPIWKLLEKHRSAREKMNKLNREQTAVDAALDGDMSSRKRRALRKKYDAVEAKYERAVDREGELGKAVITARPTTDVGLAAMIVHIRDNLINSPSEFEFYTQDGELEVFFRTLVERFAVHFKEILKQKAIEV
jgi:hypothetical protein